MKTTDWNHIREWLKKPLPGREAQNKMAVSFRDKLPEYAPKYQAAVMFLLFPTSHSNLGTVFMKRPQYTGPHGGQISFPGGRFEPDDISMETTALRETYEEIGVPPSEISILGKLTSLYIPASETLVQPFVGYSPKKPMFKIDPREVEYLIECDLDDLSNPKTVKHKPYSFKEFEGTMPYYDIKEHHIWGATAMIISEFLTICDY